MYTLRKKVIWFAIVSRIFIIVLQCICNAVLPDHDAEGVFRRPVPQTSGQSFLDGVVDFLLGGLERWDAQYFLHIAENGYVYENTLAFFPLFPIIVRFLASCLKLATFGLLVEKSLLLIASITLNTVCFVKAADALFCLSKKVLDDESLAYKAALLFCVNPASIFFSAPYSEALFVLLSFQGMRHSLESQYSELCAIPFGLAALARSNGILNVGFIIHGSLKRMISEKWTLYSRKRGFKKKLMLSFKLLPALSRMIESSIVALAPFVAYQVYCYVLFCTPQKINIEQHVKKFGQDNGLVMPVFENMNRDQHHWCHSIVPLAYSYVQDHYWNVGFLRYYEWKQIPNFMLATPIFLLIILQSKNYLIQNRSVLYHLGLISKDKFVVSVKPVTSMSSEMFVFIVHAVALSTFCLFFVHIQVSTRMICSSSPVPYWYAAYMLTYKTRKNCDRKSKEGKILVASQFKKLTTNRTSDKEQINESLFHIESLNNLNSRWKVKIISKVPECHGRMILIYFFSYTIIGTVLFSNFLPWT